MQFEELRFVCQQAAIDLVRNEGRPVPATVVLPGPERTRLVKLPQFPTDDEARHALLASFAEDEITEGQVPAWGFVAEAEAAQGTDVVVVVFGARRHAPHLTASPFTAEGDLEEFVASEELDPTAMPYLHPLQHAVDNLPPLDQGPGSGQGGLPIIGGD